MTDLDDKFFTIYTNREQYEIRLLLDRNDRLTEEIRQLRELLKRVLLIFAIVLNPDVPGKPELVRDIEAILEGK